VGYFVTDDFTVMLHGEKKTLNLVHIEKLMGSFSGKHFLCYPVCHYCSYL